MDADGDFTVKRAIQDCRTARELERRLGYRVGRLDRGGKIVQFAKHPEPNDFEIGGTTRYPGADKQYLDPYTGKPYRDGDRLGMHNDARRNSTFLPGAWHNQDLVKVLPNARHGPSETYEASDDPAEQWYLKTSSYCFVVADIANNKVTWLSRSEIETLIRAEMLGVRS